MYSLKFFISARCILIISKETPLITVLFTLSLTKYFLILFDHPFKYTEHISCCFANSGCSFLGESGKTVFSLAWLFPFTFKKSNF